MRFAWLSLPLVAAALAVAFAADPVKPSDPPKAQPDSRTQAEAAKTAELSAREAKGFDLRVARAQGARLELGAEPLLKWSNPAVGRVYGSVFLWTVDGRPEAVASIYRWYEPYKDFTAEFVSLSEKPLVTKREKREVWSPAAGIELKSVPGAPRPADAPPVRLRQMRDLAREFTVTLEDTRVEAEGSSQELRLLDRPLYRYRGTRGDLVDGALFAFVVATDPEVLLALEARKAAAAAGPILEWRYALARMNRDRLRAFRGEKEVWSAPFLKEPWADLGAGYITLNLPTEDDGG